MIRAFQQRKLKEKLTVVCLTPFSVNMGKFMPGGSVISETIRRELLKSVCEHQSEMSQVVKLLKLGLMAGTTNAELGKRHLPPTRTMIQNLASSVASERCSDSWVTRFLHCYHDQLKGVWTTGIDSESHNAESAYKPEHTYNMDEKGFAIGVLGRLKRIFSRRQYKRERSGRLARMALVSIIFASKNSTIQCRWVADINPAKHFTLQPVDVVWFKPLSSNYSNELDNHLQQSQGLSPLEKSNFFILFWPVWVSMFTTDLVKQAFKATGISPLNPDVILSRFRHDTPETTASATSGSSAYSAEDWLKACSTLRAEVKNPRSVGARKLGQTIHHLSTQLELAHDEIRISGLRQAT
ncbi:hypothetical protein EJ07DRAFT_186504 [Lizonia empirigonia]|nr:hypothetical protein EJ07DRAFT_186504 [Lizonia empirigonia]